MCEDPVPVRAALRKRIRSEPLSRNFRPRFQLVAAWIGGSAGSVAPEVAPSPQACNHNYMSTPQDDPGSADAAGTDGDTDAGSENSGTGDDMSADKASAGQGRGAEEGRGWLSGRLTGEWITAAPEIQADRAAVCIVCDV